MKYEKPALTFEQQADLLLRRGLVADRDSLIRRLRATSYFRLSGYLHPFREAGGDRFKAGTSLERVWGLCIFDQRLRTLLLDAIEAIEVFARTQLAYHFSHDFGPFSYHNPANLPNLNRERFALWHRKLDDQVQEWHAPRLPNHQAGMILTLCRHLLDRVSPGNVWTQRVLALFAEFPDVPAADMGLPTNWQQHPLWKS